jgi:hypothetical protein
MMRRQLETSKRSALIFEGRKLIGAVSRKGDGFLAIANGAQLGIFPTRAGAFAAILQTPRALAIGGAQ